MEKETSIVFRDSKKKKEIKTKQEIEVKFDRESLRLDINTTAASLVVFHNNIEEITQKNEDDVLSLKDSPMSLAKSLTHSSSSKKEFRDRRESCKGSSFFDVDEYRADIYNYLRITEVCIFI